MTAIGMPSVMKASILCDIYVTSHVGLFVNVIVGNVGLVIAC